MKLIDRIQLLCQAKPYCADDDKLLILSMWEEQGLRLDDNQKAVFLNDCSTPESITRARRELAEKGVIDVSSTAQKRRQMLAKQYRDKYARQKLLVQF